MLLILKLRPATKRDSFDVTVGEIVALGRALQCLAPRTRRTQVRQSDRLSHNGDRYSWLERAAVREASQVSRAWQGLDAHPVTRAGLAALMRSESADLATDPKPARAPPRLRRAALTPSPLAFSSGLHASVNADLALGLQSSLIHVPPDFSDKRVIPSLNCLRW